MINVNVSQMLPENNSWVSDLLCYLPFLWQDLSTVLMDIQIQAWRKLHLHAWQNINWMENNNNKKKKKTEKRERKKKKSLSEEKLGPKAPLIKDTICRILAEVESWMQHA